MPDGLLTRLSRGLFGSQAGGYLATPPDVMGDPGLGIPGFTGVARPREWAATTSAELPGVPGDAVHFVALADGTLIVDEDVSDGSLAPVAEALEHQLEPPYRALAERADGDLWTAGAHRVAIAVLSAATAGSLVELSVVGGERQLLVDGQPAVRATPELDAVGSEDSADFALRAERLDDTTWAVDVSPL